MTCYNASGETKLKQGDFDNNRITDWSFHYTSQESPPSIKINSWWLG